jgi:adenylate cyclase
MKNLKKIKSRRFNIDLTVAFAMLIVFIIASIFTVVYTTSRRTSIKLARKQFNKNSERIIEKTQVFLKSIEKAASVVTEVFQEDNKKFDYDFDSVQAKLLMRTVISYKDIALIYYGNNDGGFIQAGRLDGEIFQKKINVSEPDKAYYRYFSNTMNETLSVKPSSYDPRLRPWYIGAAKTKKVYWSEPYVFFETGELGITVSIPVFSKLDDQLIGVVGADIPLTGLSEFLRTLDLTENELALIIDNSNSIVACSDKINIVVEKSGVQIRKKIDELAMPEIQKALKSMPDKNNKNSFFDFPYNNNTYLVNITTFPERFDKKWFIIIIAPDDDFLKALQALINHIFFIALPGIVIALFITWLLAKKISNPIEQLSEDVKHVQDFNLDFNPNIKSHITEIQTMNTAIQAMKHSLKAFKLYVPQELVKQLILKGKGNINIGGNEEYLTLFFSDIADFTTISEKLPPQELMLQLSEYFEKITAVIESKHGTVDKFIGDAVMAFWGAPKKYEFQEKAAAEVALLCQNAIAQLNEKWIAEGKYPFYTRIGIHSTNVIVGNIGSTKRMNYSVLGDGVNLASRLEGVNKIYNTKIIISENTFNKLNSEFICRKLDKIAVKGKDNSVVIYELLSKSDDSQATFLNDFSKEWDDALNEYWNQNWVNAEKLFRSFLKKYPDDQPAEIFISRCVKFKNNSHNENWSDISILQNK